VQLLEFRNVPEGRHTGKVDLRRGTGNQAGVVGIALTRLTPSRRRLLMDEWGCTSLSVARRIELFTWLSLQFRAKAAVQPAPAAGR
jgi:hypothetical protein